MPPDPPQGFDPMAEVLRDIAVLRADLNALEQRVTDWRETDKEQLKLQAIEYERRLETLNGSHAEAVRVQSTFLTIENYERAHAELQRRVEDGQNELRGRLDAARGDLAGRIDALNARHETSQLAAVTANSEIRNNAERIASLSESQTWVIRLVIGAIVLGLLALLFGSAVHFTTPVTPTRSLWSAMSLMVGPADATLAVWLLAELGVELPNLPARAVELFVAGVTFSALWVAAEWTQRRGERRNGRDRRS